jgi:hypothetical protein
LVSESERHQNSSPTVGQPADCYFFGQFFRRGRIGRTVKGNCVRAPVSQWLARKGGGMRIIFALRVVSVLVALGLSWLAPGALSPEVPWRIGWLDPQRAGAP